MTQARPRPSIAIIGSGISGLAAAWLLGEDFQVTLFERRSTLGLGSEGQRVASADKPFRIDIPPRVFNAGHYSAMMELLSDADMPTYEIVQQPSFTDHRGRPYLSFQTFGEGSSTWTIPRLHPRTWPWLGRYGLQLWRWHRFLQSDELEQIERDETLAAALDRFGFEQSFRDSFLYPMWALMCTCRYEHLDEFPARPLLELFRNFTGNFATLRFKGGTKGLETRLRQRIHATALARNVLQIEAVGERLGVRTAEDEQLASFEHVIIAADPQGTEQILSDSAWQEDRALIAQVPVYKTEMILHTDTTHLPGSMVAPVNLHYDAAKRQSSATVWMNPIEYERPTETLLQSWDPMREPAEETVKARRSFQRALMNRSSQRAMAKLRASLQQDHDRRLWYVGSYVADGVPLLENGVRSAQLVTQRLRELYQLPRAAMGATG